MKKTSNNQTRAKKAIAMIHKGATWEETAAALSLSISYIQKLVKSQYKTNTGYNNLLVKARENKKNKEAANQLVGATNEVQENDIEEVIVVETGYLLNQGVEGILNERLNLYIPSFCIRELEKLAYSMEVAEKILLVHYSTRCITPVNLLRREEIFEDPIVPVKARTIGVVAVCCYLWGRGYKVRLLTNSREIEDLAKLQGIDIHVVRPSERSQTA